MPAAASLTGIGGFQPSKVADPASTSSNSSNLFGNTKFANTGVAGVFTPSGVKQNFSFTTPTTASAGSEVSPSSPVTSPLPFGGFIAPSSLQTPTTVTAVPPTSVPSSLPVDAKQSTPEKALESVVPPYQLQALLAATTEDSKELVSALTAVRTMPTVPAVIPTVAKSQPATETKTPASIFPTTESSNLNVPDTSTPAPISPLASAATTTSEGPSFQAPVLVTSAPTSDTTSTQVTSAPTGSTTTVSSFGQPPVVATTTAVTAASLFGQVPAPSTAAPLFGQQSSTSTTTPGVTTSGFGTPVFGSADGGGGGFGQPAFGQSASLWKAPASSASNFSFAPSAFGSQPVFGQQPPASTAVTSSGGNVFGGSANASSEGTFSFGQQSTSSNASTSGGSLFGQNSTPAFGQGSTFGQSAPVFGSASASTTTTSSSAFSFGQPSGRWWLHY